jgi:hypothetical protein
MFSEHTREEEEKQETERLLGNIENEYTAQWNSTSLKPCVQNAGI